MTTSPKPPAEWQYLLFSKHIQRLPLTEAAPLVKAAGFAGLDLTVRPGGSVEPPQAAAMLPRIADTLAAHGLVIGMVTTEITAADSPAAREIVAAASALGIRYLKLGYYHYAGFGTLREQRRRVKAALTPLADLCGEFGMTAGFHNHSHDFLGASLWDIDAVIAELDPRSIGLYFDPAHATIEGGSSGWTMGMDLLADRIVMLAVKDFRWVDGKHRYAGARRNSAEFCPLEQGNVEWGTVVARLRQTGFTGPVSFHSEYQGEHSFADLTDLEVLGQARRDLEFFRRESDK